MDKRSREELLARKTEIEGLLGEIDNEYQGQLLPDEQKAQWDALNGEREEIKAIVAENDLRKARIEEFAADPANTDRGAHFQIQRPGVTRGDDIYDLTTVRSTAADPHSMRSELKDRAMRAVDTSRFPHPTADTAKCQAAVEHLVKVVDSDGSISKRILATGSPLYGRAFGKQLLGQPLNSAEYNAMSFNAAMSLGTDGSGGYAVPFQLDPTIVPTSDQVVNPYRAISRIVQISGVKEWDAVTSSGVTAHRVSEATENQDDSPSLNQPTVRAERVQVFIPFSIELQQDWGGMQVELSRMIQDAKDVEEVASFTTGNGTPPQANGLLTGATTVVSTGGTGVFASTDLDLVEDALGPRFRARAVWVGSRSIYNKIRHFADDAGPDLWVRIGEPLRQGGNIGNTVLGYPAYESTSMATSVASNNKILVLGDFQYFVIVDRIGLNMELVPHLFGSSNRYPTGQRGFFAYWRNNCDVLSANAFRVLKVL